MIELQKDWVRPSTNDTGMIFEMLEDDTLQFLTLLVFSSSLSYLGAFLSRPFTLGCSLFRFVLERHGLAGHLRIERRLSGLEADVLPLH